jgi:hypothetical protein
MIIVVKDDTEKGKDEDDWGNPPSPDTPENRKKAQRAQLIIGIVALIGIFLPGLLFWWIKS